MEDESETFDGSSWTEGNNLNNGRGEFGGSGIATAALATGADKYNEEYDGTSWTEIADTSSNHTPAITSGTVTAAFCAGNNSAPFALCEEWTVDEDLQTVAFD